MSTWMMGTSVGCVSKSAAPTCSSVGRRCDARGMYGSRAAASSRCRAGSVAARMRSLEAGTEPQCSQLLANVLLNPEP